MTRSSSRSSCGQLGASGSSRPPFPPTFPLELADHLRANGIELSSDRDQFVGRRRVKNDAELAGIRRAQRAAEAAMTAARDLLRAAERQNGDLVLDGEPLTCERIKLAVEQAFTANGAFADEFIVSHGPQTAVGHDMGSGPISPDEPVCLDLFPRDRESGLLRRHDAHLRGGRAVRGAGRVPPALPRGARPLGGRRQAGHRAEASSTGSAARSSRSTATRRCSPSSRARC